MDRIHDWLDVRERGGSGEGVQDLAEGPVNWVPFSEWQSTEGEQVWGCQSWSSGCKCL